MSNPTQRDQASEKNSNASGNQASTKSQTKETQSNETTWLVSGLLILVLGIGGILMSSQEEDFQVESTTPVTSNQLLEAFPSPAIASESVSTSIPSDPTVLPVSMGQGVNSSADETAQREIEEKVIYFDFDKADLSDEAKTLLASEHQLRREGNITILVRGHTDQVGSEVYNKDLSIRRANAVKSYLVNLGHAADSIHIEGFGKTQPVCAEATDACNSKNRRANLFFSKPDSTVVNSEPIVSQTISDSNENPLASSVAPMGDNEVNPDSKLKTVQLTDSPEEIIPPDPVTSITAVP